MYVHPMSRRVFKVILVKPSHYDADGYAIQWWRSLVPSNSLASIYGLMAECASERVLGPYVDIEIEAYDECNTVIDTSAVIRKIAKAGAGFGPGLWACSLTNFPARSISPERFGRPAFRS